MKFEKFDRKSPRFVAIKVFVFDYIRNSKSWMLKKLEKKISEVSDISKFSIWPLRILSKETLPSLFSSPRFPKREKSGLLNNLQKLVQSIMIT